VRDEGMIPMVGGMLRSGSSMRRLKALETIQEFARETDQDRVDERRHNEIECVYNYVVYNNSVDNMSSSFAGSCVGRGHHSHDHQVHRL